MCDLLVDTGTKGLTDILKPLSQKSCQNLARLIFRARKVCLVKNKKNIRSANFQSKRLKNEKATANSKYNC